MLILLGLLILLAMEFTAASTTYTARFEKQFVLLALWSKVNTAIEAVSTASYMKIITAAKLFVMNAGKKKGIRKIQNPSIRVYILVPGKHSLELEVECNINTIKSSLCCKDKSLEGQKSIGSGSGFKENEFVINAKCLDLRIQVLLKPSLNMFVLHLSSEKEVYTVSVVRYRITHEDLFSVTYKISGR
ncbi:hypothetical protein Tco_0708524, partial [Tanacetum coccineum]